MHSRLNKYKLVCSKLLHQKTSTAQDAIYMYAIENNYTSIGFFQRLQQFYARYCHKSVISAPKCLPPRDPISKYI